MSERYNTPIVIQNPTTAGDFDAVVNAQAPTIQVAVSTIVT